MMHAANIRIRYRMKMRGVIREDLAEYLGVKKNTLDKYLCAEQLMPLPMFFRMCRLLAIDPVYVMYGSFGKEDV